jgi:hypothetical protein
VLQTNTGTLQRLLLMSRRAWKFKLHTIAPRKNELIQPSTTDESQTLTDNSGSKQAPTSWGYKLMQEQDSDGMKLDAEGSAGEQFLVHSLTFKNFHISWLCRPCFAIIWSSLNQPGQSKALVGRSRVLLQL